MRYLPTKGTRDQIDLLDPDLNQHPCVLIVQESVLLQKMQDGTVAEVRLEPTWRKDANNVLADGEMANLGGPRVIIRIGAECFEADLPEPLHIKGNTQQPVLFGMAMRPFHIVFGGDIDDVQNEIMTFNYKTTATFAQPRRPLTITPVFAWIAIGMVQLVVCVVLMYLRRNEPGYPDTWNITMIVGQVAGAATAFYVGIRRMIRVMGSR